MHLWPDIVDSQRWPAHFDKKKTGVPWYCLAYIKCFLQMGLTSEVVLPRCFILFHILTFTCLSFHRGHMVSILIFITGGSSLFIHPSILLAIQLIYNYWESFICIQCCMGGINTQLHKLNEIILCKRVINFLFAILFLYNAGHQIFVLYVMFQLYFIYFKCF